MKREIKVGVAYPFTWTRYSNNLPIVPSSATITFKNSSGATIQTGSATITAVTGLMTYTLLAASIPTCGANFKAVVSYVAGGVTTEFNELFDVVQTPIVNLVTDEDLFDYIRELREKIYERQGFATATGTVATLIDTGLKATKQRWEGGRIEIILSDSSIVPAEITAYDYSTGTITFSPALGAAVASATRYLMRSSFKTVIDAAFNDSVVPDLRAKAGLAANYIDSNVARMLTIYKALEVYCFSQVEAKEDKWDLRATHFADLYKKDFLAFAQPYDSNEDGNLSDAEAADMRGVGNVKLEV